MKNSTKTAAKNIQSGMTIQYVGHVKYSWDDSPYLSALQGTIKENSPIVKVAEVKLLNQWLKNNNEILIITECGLEISFSTRTRVIVLQ